MAENNKDLLNKEVLAVPKSEPEIGIDTTNTLPLEILESSLDDNLNVSKLEAFTNIAQTRETTYSLIDTMSNDSIISAILETYAEDATETNDNGQIIWCESDDENVKKYVTYLLQSLRVDKHIYDWVYSLIKYGDLYLKLFRESDYQSKAEFDKALEKKTLNEAVNESVNLIVTDKKDHYKHYVEKVANPGEMFELTKWGKSMGYIQAPVTVQQSYDANSTLNAYLNYKMKQNDVTIYGPQDYVHACLHEGENRVIEEVSIFLNDDDFEKGNVNTSYTVRKGQSLLYDSFKIWRELSLLENSVLLNRITRSAILRILSIDIGDMPKEQVNLFVQRLKEKIEQKSALSVNKNLSEYNNPGPIENILYVPTHGGQGVITQEVLGGDVDVKSLIDLDYFKDKLYGSLRVPKQYFGDTDDSTGFNGGTSLSIISSRYGKEVKRIQKTICELITDLINLFLVDKNLINYINKFTIRMQAPVTQEELDKREDMRNRVGVINDVMNQLGQYVENDVIKLKIVKILMSSAISNPDVLSLLQDQIDLLEAKEEEESEKSDTDENDNEEEITFESENMPEPSSRPSEVEFETPEEREMNEPIETNQENEIVNEPEESDFLPSANDLGIDLTNNEF